MNRFDFIESLTSINDLKKFKVSVNDILLDLVKEGFEKDEIYDFMRYIIINEFEK